MQRNMYLIASQLLLEFCSVFKTLGVSLKKISQNKRPVNSAVVQGPMLRRRLGLG